MVVIKEGINIFILISVIKFKQFQLIDLYLVDLLTEILYLFKTHLVSTEL